MRWLVAHPGPHFSVEDVYQGWVEALRELGEQVLEFNLQDRLTFYETALQEIAPPNAAGIATIRRALSREQAVHLAGRGIFDACYQWWPDVVLVISAFFLGPDLLEVLRARRHRLVVVHTEEPYEHERELSIAAHADVNLINDPTYLEVYRELGAAAYTPHAYRPCIHHPGPGDPALAADLAFVGTGYPSRIDFLEAMRLDGLDVFLGGNWQGLDDASPLRRFLAHAPDECLVNSQTAQVYRSARFGLNLYRREAETPQRAQGWAMGPREVEMAACGLPFLRESRGEGDEVLGMLPRFASADEASDQLRWWLDHPAQREAAARSARAAIEHRTFTANAAALLRLLDRQPITA